MCMGRASPGSWAVFRGFPEFRSFPEFRASAASGTLFEALRDLSDPRNKEIADAFLRSVEAASSLSTCDTTFGDGHYALLHSADIIRALVDPRVDPNDFDGRSLLLVPAYNGWVELLAFLLADSRFSSASVADALRFATYHGDYRIRTVALLLKDPRADPAALNDDALCGAVAVGGPGLVALLLADPRVNPATACEVFEWQNALVCAAQFALDSLGRERPAHSKADYAEVVALLLADPRTDPADLDRPEFAALRALPRVAAALARRRWSPRRAAWVAAAVAGAAALARADAALADALAGC